MLLACAQGMRNGMTPRKPSPMVSFRGSFRFIPAFPAESQQAEGEVYRRAIHGPSRQSAPEDS